MQLDREAVAAWFKAKAPEVERCLVCQHNAVRLATEPVEIRVFTPSKDVGEVRQAVISLVCANCGYLMLFDAGMTSALPGAPRPGIE